MPADVPSGASPDVSPVTSRRPVRLGGRLGVAFVHAYQLLLSPFAGGACRFEPSCSHYAISAFERHGLLRGGWLALRRVLKCHPFGPHGIDPVPENSRSTRS